MQIETTKIFENILSVKELKKNLNAVLDSLGKEPKFLFADNQPKAVLLSLQAFHQLQKSRPMIEETKSLQG